MAATGISEMRAPHDRILDLILVRPEITLRELALETGYTMSWISQIKRSGCFRAEYDRRRGDIEAQIMTDIPAKLAAVAELAIDKLGEQLQRSQDPDFILDSFDKALHRAGYAPKAAAVPAAGSVTNNQNNFFLVPRDEIHRARERILDGNVTAAEALPSPEQLPEGQRPLSVSADAAICDRAENRASS